MNKAVTTRWWLVRHAPVTNPERLVYGRSDMPVDLSDEKALRALSRQLPREAVWVTSHLSRTLETALKLLELMDENVLPTRETGFAEQHFGAWEKKHWNDLPKGETTRFWTDFARQQPPNGESFGDVVERVGPIFDRLTRYWAGRDIVAVIHGGTVRATLANALGLSLEAALAFHVDTLGLTRIEHISGVDQPGWRVTGVNLRF
ncbi:histidine phosphatase family protein [Thalassospira alkalitolerans]|uniref:Phosphoglycerate mutase n=1 Tax=Thalassospira alkalitolerans TaxID=1293890 RepID=A0A1Y2LGI5_9PROT|nr:histidine phosphatase family protein [Thalassospira alkalitolerans]OSQ50271.1 phosphoglycerate mutase [Thalassospira alkalitolerans]|tara:strand:- start:43105 stop:43716 length:612 start_codon:yes stop_codon:yes gene_type:complete